MLKTLLNLCIFGSVLRLCSGKCPDVRNCGKGSYQDVITCRCQECPPMTDGWWYLPLDMAGGGGRTAEKNPENCQKRCKKNERCKYFNYFPNGGCHLTDGSEGKAPPERWGPGPGGFNPTIMSGHKDCPIACRTDGWRYLPLDMPDFGREEMTPEQCRQRCEKTTGCEYFNSFPNGGCHITDGSQGSGPPPEWAQGPGGLNPTIVSGHKSCKNWREQRCWDPEDCNVQDQGCSPEGFYLDEITCPVMAAMVKNCDLKPDSQGFVTDDQTFNSMIRIGMSIGSVEAAIKNNFNHLKPPKKLNLFRMNTIITREGKGPWTEAVEHFRSTGIRDANNKINSVVNTTRLHEFLEDSEKFDLLDTLKATSKFDTDRLSSDVNVSIRPDKDGVICKSEDSVKISTLSPDVIGAWEFANVIMNDKCFSNFHGSISTTHIEFGSPPGIFAVLPREEVKDLWLFGKYPAGFQKRRDEMVWDFEKLGIQLKDLTFASSSIDKMSFAPLTASSVAEAFKRSLGQWGRRRLNNTDALVSRLMADGQI